MAYLGYQPATGANDSFKVLDDIKSYTLTFDGSSSSVVSAADDTITSNEHRFIHGQKVTYNKGGGTKIAGLDDGSYYVIIVDTNTIKLSASSGPGDAVNITGVGAGTAHTLNVAFDGTNTKFKPTYDSGTTGQITRAAQLVISLNGVIQQPVDSSSPSSGFGLDGGNIIFSEAPTTADTFWGHILTKNLASFEVSDNKVDNFTGDGSATEFTLSKSPANSDNVIVTIDGVVQYPSTSGNTRAYQVNDNSLVFSSAPANGAAIQARHIGFAGSVPGTTGVTGFYGRTGNVALVNTDNIVANDATFSGNVSIAKTLTYEDVTNIDSVGVVTARTDIHVGENIAHIDDTDTKIVFTDNQLDLQTGGFSRAYLNNYGFYIRSGFGLSFLASDGPSPAIKSGGTDAQDLLLTTGVDNPTRIQIVSGGNVGIGLTNPGEKLSVNGKIEARSGNWFISRSGDNSGYAYIKNPETSGSQLGFFTSGEKMRITSTGKVGINTTNPAAKLSIWADDSDTDTDVFQIRGKTGAFNIRVNDADAANPEWAIRTYASEPIVFMQGTTEKARIDSDGKLLIGIDASTANDSQIQSFKPTGNDSTITVGNMDTSDSGLCRYDFCPSNSTVGARIECHATEDFSTTAKRTADLVFVTRKDGVNTEKLRILSGGGVGIGDSIYHLGDTNTQIRFPGADQIQFDTGGTNYLKLHNYASVNFIEVGAAADLSFADSGSDTRYMLIGDGSHTSTGAITMQAGAGSQGHGGGVTLYSHANSTNAGGVYIGKSQGSSGSIIFGNGGLSPVNEYARITSGGKVGIGTDEPFSNLTVYAENRSGGGSVTGQITAKDNAAWNASPTGGIIFQGHYHSNGANAIFGGITGFKESTSEGNYAGALAFHTRQDGAVSEERLRIDSGGRVGIGTVDPSWGVSTGLIVGDGAGSRGITIFSNPTNVGDLAFADATSGTARYRGLIRYDHDDNSFAIRTNSIEALRILSTGEVAIGRTTKPNDINKLIVHGTSPADNYDSQLFLEGSEISGAVNTGGALAFGGHDGSTARNWGNIYAMKENGTGGNTASYMSFHTRPAGGAVTEALRINSSGYVGIGTDDPAKTLDVYGSFQVKDSGGATRLLVHEDSGQFEVNQSVAGWSNPNYDPFPLIKWGWKSSCGNYMYTSSGGNAATTSQMAHIISESHGFKVGRSGYDGTDGDVSSTAEYFRITNGGDVGIGNDSPSCKLAVKDVAEHTAYANVTPSVGDCMLQLYNNPPNETANDHSTIQMGVNGGSHNRVNTISAVAESASNRKLALTFCTDSGSNRNERMRITGDGNVGINTDNPGKLLDVTLTNTNTYSSADGNTPSANSLIRLTNKAGGDGTGSGYYSSLMFSIAYGATSTGWLTYHRTGDNKGDFTFKSRNTSSAYPELMRIKSTGHIGITNSAPLYPLHFKNAMSSSPSWIHMEVTGDNTTGGGGGIAFDTSASNASSNNSLFLATIHGERSSSDNGSNTLVFRTSKNGVNGHDGNASSPRTAMTINEDTQVRMTCAGSSRGLELNVGSNAGSLVFDRNGHITSFVRASDGNSNVAGASGGGSRLYLNKKKIQFYTFSHTTNVGDAVSLDQRMEIDESNVLIGKQEVLDGSFDTVRINDDSDKVGTVFRHSGGGGMSQHNEYCWLYNRMGTDGSIVKFNAQGSEEGAINVSGSTVSLVGAHLSRWTQLPGNAERTEILRGTVLSNLDEMCEWGDEDNEQLNRMKVSDVEGDRNVAGVFQDWDDDDDTYLNDFHCAMSGDFVIRIAQGTTVARGDLLMSAGNGTAKPQDDDIVRSKTVAKVTSTTVSNTYSDGSYCVPCVLMAS